MTRLLPALLLAALALAGCRETLTGPDPVVGPDPIDTPADIRPLYVKAADQLYQDETIDVRAEPIAEAVQYRWIFLGTGNVQTVSTDPYGRERVLDAVGMEPGPVLITARAYDAEGNLLAEGSKAVEVLRR